MIASERRNKLVNIINSRGSLGVSEASKALGVSTETIRKDFNFLDEHGLIQKEFGGAVAVNEFIEQPLNIRSMENIECKSRIAKRAMDLLAGNNVIYIDSGSTMLLLAQMLGTEGPAVEVHKLAVVTNSFYVVEKLANKIDHVYFLGGEVNFSSMSVTGFWAQDALKSLKIDLALLGSSGFQSHTGPSVKSFSDANYKKAVLAASATNVILADNSKFTSNAIIQYASWQEIDMLITDDGAPITAVEEIGRQTNVVVV